MTLIAFAYEADYHCEECTKKRFGRMPLKDLWNQIDNEGNMVNAIYSWDEWWEPTEDTCETLVCGDCFRELDVAHRHNCEESAGEEECDASLD